MSVSPSLLAISPLDGRYSHYLTPLNTIFSEAGLITYRYEFEYTYLNFLITLLDLKPTTLSPIPPPDTSAIKILEKITNHDVKAVELYIKSQLDKNSETKHLKNYVHFGLTSQDVNTTAYTLQLKDYTQKYHIPLLKKTFTVIHDLAPKEPIPMLCLTHGQPATPSTLQLQLKVFTSRLIKQLTQLETYKFRTKLGGATGSLNAHKLAFPTIDWERSLSNFLSSEFNITRLQDTTQISHYDDYSELFAIYHRINTILIDFTRDIWQYISMNYLTQILNPLETGSSTMPHKVNPIDFENAEGNLQMSNVLLQHFQTKLPISRLQRDLTDSTTLRNLGTAFSHSYLALISINRGLTKITPNTTHIVADLNSHPEILAEAYQTVLRTVTPPLTQDPYELFKNFTRGKPTLTLDDLHTFLETLKSQIPSATYRSLISLTPTGYAVQACTKPL